MMLPLRRYLSIKTKLILLFLFFCMSVFAFLFIWYKLSGDIIEKNTYDFTCPIVKQTSDYMDSYVEGLEKVSIPLTLSPLINKFLDIGKFDYYDQFYVGAEIKNDIYPKLIDGRNDIFMFSIISRKGIYYTNGDEMNMETLLEAYNVKISWNDDKSFGIQGIRFIKNIPTITIFRDLSYPYAYGTKGTAIISLNLQQIQSFSEIKLGNTGFIYIIDWEGNYLYHPDMNRLGKEVDKEIKVNMESGKTGYFIEEISGQEKLFVYDNSGKSGCIVICEVPMAELTGALIGMRNISFGLTFLVITIILLGLGGYSYYITNSMNNLRRLMKRVECGELNVRAHINKNDEFGELNNSFNAMVSEIRRLIEVVHISQLNEKEAQLQHKEAVLHALQSQINPHFLYNVLETINSYAIIKGVMPISNMVTGLSDLFRYCVNNTRYIVTLEEEIEHVKTYLTIQTERTFSLKVEYAFEEQEALSSVKCPRLSLQPIVENAFIHGYEKNDLSPEYIGIFGRKYSTYYELSIIDKGKGMCSDTAEYYNDRFVNELVTGLDKKEDKKSGISIGMWNVHKRIKLIFGEPYGLLIMKTDETGTEIIIKLPYV